MPCISVIGVFYRVTGQQKYEWNGNAKVTNVTKNEMAKTLSVSRRTVQRGLFSLKGKGIIERKGGKRYGYWELHEYSGEE